MSLSRKEFLAATALAASAAALVPGRRSGAAEAAMMKINRAPLSFRVLNKSQYDHDAMMKVLTVNMDHKQVFESVGPLIIGNTGIASLYIHMQNALNAYEFSYGLGKGSLATLGILIGPSIVYALNDAMWAKYHFGRALKMTDSTGKFVANNAYYYATSTLDPNASMDGANGMYQDWSAQAVLARGGSFMVCHNAMTAVADLFAFAMKLNPAAVLADFEKNVLPGFLVIPAGVAGIQLAQENGWKIYTII